MRKAPLSATTVIAIVLAGSYGCHPTDRHVIAGFERHRAEYEQIVALAEQDRHLETINRTWYRTLAGDYYESPQAGLLSEQRWSQYRRLFDVLQLDEGISIADGSIYFLRSCVGLSVSGSTKGIAYFTQPPATACEGSSYRPGDVAFEDTCYRHLSGKWYLFLWT